MKNYLQEGDVLEVIVTGAVPVGNFVKVGDLLGVSSAGLEANVAGSLRTTGAISDAPKSTSVAFTQGQKVYWDVANGHFDDDSTNNEFKGYATEAVISSASTFTVKLVN